MFPPGTRSKTSSGKLRRTSARAALKSGGCCLDDAEQHRCHHLRSAGNPACWSNFRHCSMSRSWPPACTSIEVDPVADEIAVMIREHGFDEKQLRGGGGGLANVAQNLDRRLVGPSHDRS